MLFIFLIFCIVYFCFACLRVVSSVLNIASLSRGLTYKRNQENTYTYSLRSNEQFIWLTVMEYMSQMTTICSTCRKHFPVLSLFMTYHRVGNYINTMGVILEQELPTLPEHLSSSPNVSGIRVTRCLVCMFCSSLFVLLSLFILAIVLSVFLRLTDSYYLISIFKLFVYL